MPKYLDENGLLYFWQKIKTVFASKAEGVKNITRTGTTFTVTRADGTTFTFTQQDNTVAKTTTTPKANGTAAIGSETKYAAGDHVHPLQTTITGNAGTATALQTARTIDGVNFDGSAAISHYGVSSTAAGTATKLVSVSNFTLVEGAWVAVKFSVTNTAAVANLKLNVNSTGEKSIKYRGSNLPAVGTLTANRLYLFVYDGTNYELVGDLDTNTTYTPASAAPLMDAITAAVGSSAKYAREDHVHPSDTSKVDVIEGKGLSTNDYTTAEKNKLGGIATGAEVNQNAFSNVKVGSTTVAADSKTDTLEMVAGSNVTITPDATNNKITIAATDTVTTANTTGSGNAVTAITATNGALTVTKGSTFILSSAKGAASGVCPLNASSKIDSQYLPSFVDDIVEAYARSGQTALSSTWLATGSASGTVITPETGKIYVLMEDSGDYAANSQFRWSGSAYVKLNDGGVSAITNAEIDTILAA